MDFDKIKNIKIYVDQIKKFKKLKCNQELDGNDFYIKMRTIFPKFDREFPGLFRNVCKEKSDNILQYMFKKIDDIEVEFNSRKAEIAIVEPFIKDAEEYLKGSKSKKNKNRLINHFRDSNLDYPIPYKEFVEKYPKIIDRLADDEYLSFDPKNLLFEQIKFSHEVMVGEVLKEKYIDPVMNNQ